MDPFSSFSNFVSFAHGLDQAGYFDRLSNYQRAIILGSIKLAWHESLERVAQEADKERQALESIRIELGEAK